MIACLVVLGCSQRERVGDGPTGIETGVDLETDSETSTSDGAMNDESSCVDSTCDAMCSQQSDECGNTFLGECMPDGTCMCDTPLTCVDCSGVVCDMFEHCLDFAGCTPCWKTTYVAWDPNLDCTLDLSVIEPFLIPYVAVRIAGESISITQDCITMPAAMMWIPGEQVQLCDAACDAFELAGEIEVEIGCPGGP